MKVQCELCREIVDIGDFQMTPRGIEITCVGCGGHYTVAPAAAPGPRALADDETACPKCDAATPDEAAACQRCGLARDKFDGFELGGDADVPEALTSMWDACESDWTDSDAHDRFVKAAVVAEAYRYAAARYRQALRQRPGDETARDRLADVARRAEAAILQSAAARRYEPERHEPYKNVAIMLIVLVGLMALGAVWAMFLRDRAVDGAEQRTAPPAGARRGAR